MRILGRFCREHIKDICLYAGFAGVFIVVFCLYNIELEAVKYGFLLTFVWVLVYGVAGFIRYYGRHRALVETEQKIITELEGIPAPGTLIEEDYQNILRRLYEDKLEIESDMRISKQETADYYGMWVHQIKTPIAAMRILLQSWEEEGDKESALRRDMKVELFKIEQYVEMVLLYLRMGDMSSDLDFQEYQLDDVIRQAIRKYSKMFILRKIRLDFQETGKRVLTDEKWLVFVIEQILSNGLKYTKKGSISIYMEEDALVIRDTGIGISPEDLPRVFEKGFTGYNGRRDKKSTGIGLYLCKSILDRLGHKIEIRSQVGQGTSVYLRLDRDTYRLE